MSYLPITELLHKVDTRYRLVIMVSQRSRQLIAHAKPLLSNVENEKPINIALREIFENKIYYKDLKEKIKTKKN